MSLATRLTAAMVLLVVLTAVAVGFLSYRSIEATFVPAELVRLDSRAQMQAVSLGAHVASARADILSGMGPASLQGFVAVHVAGGKDPRSGTPESVWRKRLTQNFVAQLSTKPEYAEFRLIGIEDNGRELVRVDRIGPRGDVRVIPDNQLQQKADRDYFKATIKLGRGQIYLSPLDLNQENGVIETPHRPVLRAATPVFTDEGALFGLLIVNVDMRAALDEIARSVRPGGAAYLVNGEGDYLLHPDREREFGFDLGHRYRVQEDFPALAPVLESGRPFSGVVRDTLGHEFAVATAPINLAGGPLAIVIEAIPRDVLMDSAAGVQRATLMGGFFAALAATLLAVLIARSLARPLMQMANSLAAFSGEEEIALPTQAGGETGVLARAFARMAANVRNKTAALQREIGERARIEERERIYVSAVESAHDAIVLLSSDGTLTNWNAGAEALFGYSAKEAIGQPISIIAPPDRQEEQFEYLRRLHLGERIDGIETVRCAKDGTFRDISLTISPITNSEGKLVGASAIYRDIGPRKLAEEHFRLAVEASPSGMIMADRNGIIRLVNAETERMFGYDRNELIGMPVETLIPSAARAKHERDRTAYIAKPSQRSMGKGRDLFGVRKDRREVAVEVGLSPIAGREGPMIMASIVDISQRKHNERMLEERAKELQRSNADLEQFAYVASHDLQEPLRMVASYAELLAERYRGKLDEKADKYIGYAVDGAKRMQRLVNDLLSFSRAGRSEPVSDPADLNLVMEDVMKNLQRAVEQANAKVEIAPLPVVDADPGQIAQVFQNLVGNALKFHGERPPVVRIGAEPSGNGWKFSVEDNGIGIEEQYSERIFQMFQRLHDRASYDGSGIGLPIAKKIVERHGGRIWFESVPGEGTTFYFTLPKKEERAA